MDAAQQAINKLFTADSKSTTTDETVAPAHVNDPTTETVDTIDTKVDPVLENKTVTKEEEVAPAVEHETIKKEHETQEQVIVDKERHQHHYHTTVQPLKDQEVLPTKVDEETTPAQVKEFDHDDGADVEGQAAARNAEFKSTTEEAAKVETKTTEQIAGGENVHHHLHETIQPVIEKETIQPSVTKKTVPITEIHHDASQDHGTTIKPPVSVDDFERRLDGEAKTEEVVQEGVSKVEPVTRVD